MVWRLSYSHVLFAAQLFEPAINPPTIEAEDMDGENTTDENLNDGGDLGWEGRPYMLKLIKFCGRQFKSQMVKDSLCDGAFDMGALNCINGSCPHCGFRQIWSKGLRPHVLDANGDVKSDAPVEFQSQLKWSRIKSSGGHAEVGVEHNGEAESRDLLHQQRSGRVIEFLDEFERDVSVCPSELVSPQSQNSSELSIPTSELSLSAFELSSELYTLTALGNVGTR